jgi:hypothetical protein
MATTTAKAVAAAASTEAPTVAEAPPEATPVVQGAAQEGELQDMFKAVEGRWGSREVEINDVTLLDRDGQPSHVFHSGDPMAVRLKVHAHLPTNDFVFGVSLFNAEGVCCYGTNTYLEEMEPNELAGDAELTFGVDSLDLVEGTYKLDAAVHKRDGYPYDYHRLLYTFRVKSRTHDVGIYRPRHRWTFAGGVSFRPSDGRGSGS